MWKRRLFKQEPPLKDQLASFAETARSVAELLPPGTEKDDLLGRAGRADTAARNINEWLESPGLQSPPL